VDRVDVERMTRLIPYARSEIAWIRCRPAADRTPLPESGDVVLFRLQEWEEPLEAIVERVQPFDDVDDPHLCAVESDEHGEIVLVEGRPVFSQLEDPWPLVWVKVDLGNGATERHHSREARLRGAAGWLPLDWRSRRRPLPADFAKLLDAQAGKDGS